MRTADGKTLSEFIKAVEEGECVLVEEFGQWGSLDFDPRDDMPVFLNKIAEYGLSSFMISEK